MLDGVREGGAFAFGFGEGFEVRVAHGGVALREGREGGREG
jgi:hypothetical protein